MRGAKNFALKAIAATILAEEPSKITNVPAIVDVGVMFDLLKKLGADVQPAGERTMLVTAKDIDGAKMDAADAQKVRASVVLTGPILARFREVTIPHPGGDVIGKRPINFFIDGFVKMGAKVEEYDQGYRLSAPQGLSGTSIFFPKVSVTGTETLVMAATLARGTTTLVNAAMEPEVVHLCECLNKMGAKISGMGSSVITIKGVEKLGGGTFDVIPDRIETGTFVMMGIMNNSHLTVENCQPAHLEALLTSLREAGANLEIGTNSITTKPIKGRIKSVSMQTHEYPGFATDLQPIYTLLMTQAEGMSLIHDPIFEGRLFFTDMLNRMGARIIMCDPHRVVVNGPSKLYGRSIESPDIRAGITLLLAAIMAEGKSIIQNANIIDRGYERIEERLKKIGVEIARKDS